MVNPLFRSCLYVCLVSWLHAALMAEVRLELPDPLIPGVWMTGELVVSDVAGTITAIELPGVPGIELRREQGTKQQTSIVNGKASTRVTFTVAVKADAVGSQVVPAATIRMRDGTSHQSAPVTVRVDHGDAGLKGDAVADVRFEPDHIVPGEQATMIYRVRLRRGQIRSLAVQPPPALLTLGERQDGEGRSYDAEGRPWATFTYRWPVTSASTGVITVQGRQEVLIPMGDGFFDNRAMQQFATVTPGTLTVAALPEAGRPEDFAGLVGEVTVTATLAPEQVALGDGARLTVTVTGRQVELLRRLPLTMPDGVRAYARDPEEIDGGRVFRWDLVPEQPGTYTVPQVSVPWFDAGTRSYRRAAGTALTLVVVPGRNSTLQVAGSVPTVLASAPGPTVPVVSPVVPTLSVGWPWAALALVAGMAIGAGAVLLSRPRSRRDDSLRDLERALAAGDLASAHQAAQRLEVRLRTEAGRGALRALVTMIEHVRFGGGTLGETKSLLAAVRSALLLMLALATLHGTEPATPLSWSEAHNAGVAALAGGERIDAARAFLLAHRAAPERPEPRLGLRQAGVPLPVTWCEHLGVLVLPGSGWCVLVLALVAGVALGVALLARPGRGWLVIFGVLSVVVILPGQLARGLDSAVDWVVVPRDTVLTAIDGGVIARLDAGALVERADRPAWQGRVLVQGLDGRAGWLPVQDL